MPYLPVYMVQTCLTTFLLNICNFYLQCIQEYTACIPIEVFSSLPNLYLKVKSALYNPKNATEFLRGLVINYPDVSVEQKNK